MIRYGVVLGCVFTLSAMAGDQTTSREWTNCQGGPGIWSDLRLSACNELIKSGKAAGDELAKAYYYRGNAWTNAQSTGDIAQPPAAAASAAVAQPHEVLPDGIRMVVTTGGKILTRDIALAPHGS